MLLFRFVQKKEIAFYPFWAKGYWKKGLGKKKYHISAMLIVDLDRFRTMDDGTN
jgi:UDP-glucose:glycoprotein glucosyltransferase